VEVVGCTALQPLLKEPASIARCRRKFLFTTASWPALCLGSGVFGGNTSCPSGYLDQSDDD